MKVLDLDEQKMLKDDTLRTFNDQACKFDYAGCGKHARSLYAHVLRQATRAYRAWLEREEAAGRFENGRPKRRFRVLDVGCGTGALAEIVLNSLPAAELTGVDISPEMLRQSRMRLAERATFINADAEKLPFGDGQFDLVIMNDVFHHCPNPRRASFEAWRVLAHEGILVLGDVWSANPLRAINNVLLPIYGEGDVRIYSEDELCSYLNQWFGATEWRQVGSDACLAVATK